MVLLSTALASIYCLDPKWLRDEQNKICFPSGIWNPTPSLLKLPQGEMHVPVPVQISTLTWMFTKFLPLQCIIHMEMLPWTLKGFKIWAFAKNLKAFEQKKDLYCESGHHFCDLFCLNYSAFYNKQKMVMIFSNQILMEHKWSMSTVKELNKVFRISHLFYKL